MPNNLFAEKHYKLQLKKKSGYITPPEDGFSEIYVDENSTISGVSTTLLEKTATYNTTSGDISGSLENPKVIKIQGRPVYSDPPSHGQILQWDGSSWTPANVSGTPVGSIFPWTSKNIPSGFLKCDGAALKKTEYSALWNVLGDTYKTSTSTHFYLPNISPPEARSRFICGINKLTDTNANIAKSIAPKVWGEFDVDDWQANHPDTPMTGILSIVGTHPGDFSSSLYGYRTTYLVFNFGGMPG
jgi:hypothetical protein